MSYLFLQSAFLTTIKYNNDCNFNESLNKPKEVRKTNKDDGWYIYHDTPFGAAHHEGASRAISIAFQYVML